MADTKGERSGKLNTDSDSTTETIAKAPPSPLKQWRFMAGRNQKSVADELRISTSHLGHVENGRTPPGRPLAFRLHGLTKLSLDAIYQPWTVSPPEVLAEDAESQGETPCA